MRVVHVFKDAFPPTYGGIEQHVWEVTSSLSAEFEFDVLTSARSRRRTVESLGGVRIVRTPEYGRILSTPLTPGWRRELQRSRGAVLHVHAPNPLAELACLGRRRPGPVVVSFHADVVRHPAASRGYAMLQRRLLSWAQRIAVSSPVLAETSPSLAPHRDRVVLLPYGVDPDEWPARAETVGDIRRTHGDRLVLFLGRLVHYKGVETLIEAMRAVDATLLVVGDGPRRRALGTAARDAGVEGRVRFVGNVSNEDRSAYYEAADLFVLPAVSRAEAFGIAMLEAMSHGTPVVSTEVGTGTSWVNRSGETGIVVPPRDPAALARAISLLLADEDSRRAFGEAAARRARREFSKQVMLDRLADLYRSTGS